jgi:membrane protein
MTKEKSRIFLWRETPFLRVLNDLGNFLLFALRRFVRDGMSQAAAALTFSTLLALVPLLVIVFSVLSGFEAFSTVQVRIEDALLGTLIPEVGVEVKSYLTEFTSSAGSLTTVGTVALAVTAVLLLSTIESTLNQIWGVERPRPMLNRLLIFWAILTVGPILLGASFTLTSDVLDKLQSLTRETTRVDPTILGSTWVKSTVGVLTQSTAFTLLFTLVPARRVQLRYAAIGGVFAGVGLQILRWSFNIYFTSGSTYSTIYGAVAVFPIFLMWIYLSWTVIILGAVLAASFPDWWRRRAPPTRLPLTPAETLEVTVAVLAVLSRKARKGGTIRQEKLAESVPLLACDEVVERLRGAGYISETEHGQLCLARDLHVTTVADLARDMGLALGLHVGEVQRPGLAAIARSTGGLPDLLVRLWDVEDDLLGETVAAVIAEHAAHREPIAGPVTLPKPDLSM